MEDYYQDKRQKRNDFWLGFLINFVVAVFAFSLATIIFFIYYDLSQPAKPNADLISGIGLSIAIILVAIPEFYFIRKHLKKRRYIAIGMISSLVIPLLIIGACTPLVMFGF